MVDMFPILFAQAAAVDMSTPIALTVVILLLGLAAAFGASQSQISRLKEDVADLATRITKREEHGGEVDKALTELGTTLKRVDANVERLLAGPSSSHQRTA